MKKSAVPSASRLGGLTICGIFAAYAAATPAIAGPLVTNGTFSQNSTLATEASETASYNAAHGTTELSGVIGTNAQASQVTGWSFGAAGSFDFVIDLNTYANQYSPTPPGTNGTVAYWDNGNTHYSAFNVDPGADPHGDQFAIASDPTHLNAAITQTITGLVAGDRYQLTFDQASAQQYGYGGSYTGKWQVSLGSQTQFSATMSNPSGGDSPWTTQTLDFIASGSTETLSFLSTASVGANPPFLLLDNIGLSDIPEPAEAGITIMAVAAIIAGKRRRQHR